MVPLRLLGAGDLGGGGVEAVPRVDQSDVEREGGTLGIAEIGRVAPRPDGPDPLVALAGLLIVIRLPVRHPATEECDGWIREATIEISSASAGWLYRAVRLGSSATRSGRGVVAGSAMKGGGLSGVRATCRYGWCTGGSDYRRGLGGAVL